MSVVILGGGVTGLAAGYASGAPVFEAAESPGGICSSYYMRPGETGRLAEAPADGDAYRFEIGGGHWIFGGDQAVLRFIDSLSPLQRYSRLSSIYFPDSRLTVPYPLQDHLRFVDSGMARRALEEMAEPSPECRTMSEWLNASFGPTLGALFFGPFHQLYTAGLCDSIAPQDSYKSPVNIHHARRGATGSAPSAGYNVSYAYPRAGLDHLARALGARCDIQYGKVATSIDAIAKEIHFADGSSERYDTLLNTLPLDRTLTMAGLDVGCPADPCTSVLVLNIGARRGDLLPDDHWIYVPRSHAGFHRVGCYSNVDRSFVPASARVANDRVSLYIERAFAGHVPDQEETDRYAASVVEELQTWGFIKEVEVVDPTWIDVAYTWAWPGSDWRGRALRLTAEHDIVQVGRYARWTFQGIADSIRDGLVAGAANRR